MSQINVFKLNNSINIPAVGMGVYQMPDNDNTRKAIEFALNIGYRHIDTAMIYGNERSVGKAVNSGIIPRKEIFITTKVWNSDHGYDQAIRAFNASLNRLQLEYIDLYLIHWPVMGKRKETWRALETLYNEGKVRAIGVSNYMVQHLNELLGHCKITPAVNQLELHPFIYGSRIEIINLCHKNNILPVAYSPLTKGEKLRDPFLIKKASKYRKNTAQLMLRWGIQHGFAVIPKSSVTSRIAENKQIFDFEILPDDMIALDKLNEHLATGWDPSDML
ncbi:MAG TPA: aldo/keto reductase [Lentimicrobium sp.]|nr:aldo/keto reductase [Lentimicrobium sp.]